MSYADLFILEDIAEVLWKFKVLTFGFCNNEAPSLVTLSSFLSNRMKVVLQISNVFISDMEILLGSRFP
jgi:hypothetical protein